VPAQDAALVLRSPPLCDPIDTITELKQIQRFQNVIVGAKFHGIHCRLHRPMTRHDEKARLGVHLANRLEQIEPVNTGHFQIADYQVNILERFDMLQGRFAATLQSA
jgi:hypothetical protein